MLKLQNTTNINKKSLLDTVSVQLQKYKFLSFFILQNSTDPKSHGNVLIFAVLKE